MQKQNGAYLARVGLCIRKIQLEVKRSSTHFGCQIFENGSTVDGSGGSNTSMACCAVLQMTMDTTDWELFWRKHKNLIEWREIEAIVSFHYFSIVTCNPARAERDTALAFAFPESFPAFPPA